MSRSELFSALCILGFANGTVGRVLGAVEQDGATLAIINTFDISVVVWAAFIACPVLLLCSSKEPVSCLDRKVAICALAAFLLPIPPMSWIALTGLAFYLIWDPPKVSGQRHLSLAYRSAWILLATTSAMFWARVLMLCVSRPILNCDALLVGWLTGTERAGNMVRFADGQGYLWIAPACSSLSNISLAILCWVLFTQVRGLRWSLQSMSWCLIACSSIIAINTIRIGLMVMHRDSFDLIHGPTGASLTNWLIVAVVLGVCLYGTRSNRVACA